MSSQYRAKLRRLAAGLLLAVAGPAAAVDYTLGQGLVLGDSGVTLGGYLTTEVQRLSDGRRQLRSSHASVFAWWEGFERLKLLAELDLENAVAERRGPFAEDSAGDGRLSLQRAHADWTFDDALTLRGGKFLTPVGRWNLSHAGPLVWTTSRPLLTQSVYARQVTGLMALGRVQPHDALSLAWSAYGSNGQEWDADPRQDLFARVRGARVVATLAGEVQAGLSWARYEQRGSRGEVRALAGLDLQWSRHGWELLAEWLQTEVRRPLPPGPRPGVGGPGVRRPQPRSEPTRGAYVQGVAPLAPGVSLVARVERLRDTAAAMALRQTTLGLAWRPLPALSLKAEHQWSRGRDDLAVDGWSASLSVLF